MVADVVNPASVECGSLPSIYRATRSPWFVDADICHRFPFNARETVLINGVAYQCSELRINLPSGASPGASLDGLVGIDLDGIAVDSMILSRVVAGPLPIRFLPPLRYTEDDGTGHLRDLISIGWDAPWTRLETSPGVRGPWSPVSTDGTEVTVPVGNGIPAQFYRLSE
jgi:hypothetical protein